MSSTEPRRVNFATLKRKSFHFRWRLKIPEHLWLRAAFWHPCQSGLCLQAYSTPGLPVCMEVAWRWGRRGEECWKEPTCRMRSSGQRQAETGEMDMQVPAFGGAACNQGDAAKCGFLVEVKMEWRILYAIQIVSLDLNNKSWFVSYLECFLFLCNTLYERFSGSLSIHFFLLFLFTF